MNKQQALMHLPLAGTSCRLLSGSTGLILLPLHLAFPREGPIGVGAVSVLQVCTAFALLGRGQVKNTKNSYVIRCSARAGLPALVAPQLIIAVIF